MLGIFVTYGTFGFLLILSGLFALVVLAISKLPVPEHFNFAQVVLDPPRTGISALVYLELPVFGLFLFAISLLGIVIVLFPRSWKVNVKMALRNHWTQTCAYSSNDAGAVYWGLRYWRWISG